MSYREKKKKIMREFILSNCSLKLKQE
uniref:Uncharacterized protein n=1 Tax=Rhizophora mucronata TaxID=61149 RepID=A0A2P2QEG3_RHIMU